MAQDDDTKQKRVCTVHKKYTSIYTPYSLSSEFTRLVAVRSRKGY